MYTTQRLFSSNNFDQFELARAVEANLHVTENVGFQRILHDIIGLQLYISRSWQKGPKKYLKLCWETTMRPCSSNNFDQFDLARAVEAGLYIKGTAMISGILEDLIGIQ